MFKFLIRYIKNLCTKKEKKKRLIDLANSFLPNKNLEKITPLELGIDITEDIIAKNILPLILGEIKRKMPYRHHGFDYVMTNNGRNIKVNVKSGILLDKMRWIFVLKRYDNRSGPVYEADYFLCFGYDYIFNKPIRILHMWLIDKNFASGLRSIRIRNDEKSLLEFSKYEISDLMV